MRRGIHEEELVFTDLADLRVESEGLLSGMGILGGGNKGLVERIML